MRNCDVEASQKAPGWNMEKIQLKQRSAFDIKSQQIFIDKRKYNFFDMTYPKVCLNGDHKLIPRLDLLNLT